jgi:hypothetical protein
MRKLITAMKISVDGMVAGQDGSADEQYWTAIQNEPHKPLPMTAKSPAPDEVKWSRQERTMSNPDFTTTILVDQGTDVAYAAINNVRGWWSQDIQGSTDTLGGVFTHHYGDMHRCKIEVVELVPNRRVVWLVLDNYFDFTKDETEWKGTRIVFDIARKGARTEVRFTHEGLVADYECFNVCSNGWRSSVNGGLRQLIAAGKGSPDRKEARKVS